VRHAENGGTVAMIAHGKHGADVVTTGQVEWSRDTVDVLFAPDSIQALADTEPAVSGRDAIVTWSSACMWLLLGSSTSTAATLSCS
jgi:hypothetical protein